MEETGKRTAKEVFDTKQLQDRAAKSHRSTKKRMRVAELGDELADNDGLASCDENQSPKRQKRNSYNPSSSLPTSPRISPRTASNSTLAQPASTCCANRLSRFSDLPIFIISRKNGKWA